MTTEQKFAKHYEANGGRKAGTLPWAEIIAAILKVLSGCVSTPGALKRWARRKEDAFVEIVANEMKAHGWFSSAGDRFAAANAAHPVFLSMPNKEIAKYMGS